MNGFGFSISFGQCVVGRCSRHSKGKSAGVPTVRPSRPARFAIGHLRMRKGGWLPEAGSPSHPYGRTNILMLRACPRAPTEGERARSASLEARNAGHPRQVSARISSVSSRPIPSPSASCSWRWRARSTSCLSPASTCGSATCSTGRSGFWLQRNGALGFLRATPDRRPHRGRRSGADRLDGGEAGTAGEAQSDTAGHSRLPALDPRPCSAPPRQCRPYEQLRDRRGRCRSISSAATRRMWKSGGSPTGASGIARSSPGKLRRRSGSSPSPWCCRRRSAHRRWLSPASMRSFCPSIASPSAGASSPMSSFPSVSRSSSLRSCTGSSSNGHRSGFLVETLETGLTRVGRSLRGRKERRGNGVRPARAFIVREEADDAGSVLRLTSDAPRITTRSLNEARRVAASCTRCDLYRNATQTVFGEGPISARIMLVGEQPGDNEDIAGRPFVGPAGGVLDRALDAAGIERKAIYLTNGVKHFKNEPRGGRRVSQTSRPGQRSISAAGGSTLNGSSSTRL